jgi:hypothetical protein
VIGEPAGRAMDLIQGINACKRADAAFWRGIVTRIVCDLDEVADERAATSIADLRAEMWDKLEDRSPRAKREGALRAPCPVCHLQVGLYRGGWKLLHHNANGVRCPGSGTLTEEKRRAEEWRRLTAALEANPAYQAALRDAESESWDRPGIDGAEMIDAATERRRAWRASLRGGSAAREGGS